MKKVKPRKPRRTRIVASCVGSPIPYTGQTTLEYVEQYFAKNRLLSPAPYIIGGKRVVL